MKNIKHLVFVAFILLSTFAFAQAPEKISYQAVIRNASNNLVTSQSVGMKISILQGSATGTAVYVETQNPTSNSNGLISIQIGGGTVVSGTMAAINWATDTYFIKTETDPAGGSSYTISGTSQLLSVPYALNSKNGVAKGGTTGQVLAKVNATDYNAQWVAPTFTATYPNVEVNDMVTIQNIVTVFTNSQTAPLSQILVFSGTNNTNAILTGGNTWNGSRFTAGTGGWYQIQVQVNTGSLGNNNPSPVGVRFLLDKNDAVGTATRLAAYAYSTYDFDSSGNGTLGIKTSNILHAIIYLAANDYINLKGWSIANGVNAHDTTDGSTNITIVRLK